MIVDEPNVSKENMSAKEILVQLVLPGNVPLEVIQMGVTINGEIPVVFKAGYSERPSVLYRPKLFIEGDQWCALYGDNLQEGLAGFGNTPSDAMKNFDAAWVNELP